jgi:uncharacterized protein (DUF488 family)
LKNTASRSSINGVLTVGHSNRPLDDFIALLKAHGVERLVDIRTVPRSRHNPQFNRDALPESLEQAGIGYLHMGSLGGLRHPRPDSANSAWRNDSFRGYADYMQSPEFEKALDELIEVASRARVAIMCAEAVPWRCHRSLVADALTARGGHVEHIMSATKRNPHSVTPFARIENGRVTYPGVDEI